MPSLITFVILPPQTLPLPCFRTGGALVLSLLFLTPFALKSANSKRCPHEDETGKAGHIGPAVTSGAPRHTVDDQGPTLQGGHNHRSTRP